MPYAKKRLSNGQKLRILEDKLNYLSNLVDLIMAGPEDAIIKRNKVGYDLDFILALRWVIDDRSRLLDGVINSDMLDDNIGNRLEDS